MMKVISLESFGTISLGQFLKEDKNFDIHNIFLERVYQWESIEIIKSVKNQILEIIRFCRK